MEAGGQANTRRNSRAGEHNKEVNGRAGRWTYGRVKEATERQGGVAGLMEELGGLESLGDSGNLACREKVKIDSF